MLAERLRAAGHSYDVAERGGRRGDMDNAEAHALRAEKGTSKVATRTVRGLSIPYMKLLYALKIEGAENIPERGR